MPKANITFVHNPNANQFVLHLIWDDRGDYHIIDQDNDDIGHTAMKTNFAGELEW